DEIVAHQHGVERHHAAIGKAEDEGDAVELYDIAGEEVRSSRHGLHDKACDENWLGAQAVAEITEQHAPAQSGEPFEGIDCHRGHGRYAAAHGAGNRVE